MVRLVRSGNDHGIVAPNEARGIAMFRAYLKPIAGRTNDRDHGAPSIWATTRDELTGCSCTVVTRKVS